MQNLSEPSYKPALTPCATPLEGPSQGLRAEGGDGVEEADLDHLMGPSAITVPYRRSTQRFYMTKGLNKILTRNRIAPLEGSIRFGGVGLEASQGLLGFRV